MTYREIVRNKRRQSIDDHLRHSACENDLVQKLISIPSHLRTTFVLDLEEFVHGNSTIILYYPWLKKFNLKNLWDFLKLKGFA